MSSLTVTKNRLLPVKENAVSKVRDLEAQVLKLPQIQIATEHTLHAGMYARTIMLPAGAVLTSALIKIATILIASGHFYGYVGEKPLEMKGYHVLAASAYRIGAWVAIEDTYFTMVFKTDAITIAEAEEQFTDDAHKLMSRGSNAVNTITITGEM